MLKKSASEILYDTKENLNVNELLLVADFSVNYKTKKQNQI